MKIRSVELTNFRKFVGTVSVENIGDNVSVLVGRNELGKSTLLDAINGVIFERAKSSAAHVKGFRHFVNGTVPEVRLAFDIGGKEWTVHKRFAGPAGKATLTCSDNRIFEDDAAEVELQRLLGFNAGSRGGEPGIWGTLWVQQGQSFGNAALDEQAQRTMQGCLESQVGLVTGGTRGQKIPKAIGEALEALRSSRGPRGKYKDAIERLAESERQIGELLGRQKTVFGLMEDLARNKRELQQAEAAWDEEGCRLEIDSERAKRTAAATRAAEIASARDAALLARERATNARKKHSDRIQGIAELESLEGQFVGLQAEAATAAGVRAAAQESVIARERMLTELRLQARHSADRGRRLENVRAAVLLNAEINQHQATLDKAVVLESETLQLSERIGGSAATDDAVTRIEGAVTELAAAESAMNAVATTISFAIEDTARERVSIDGAELSSLSASLPILGRTIITIRDVGMIMVEPQIKNHATLLRRRQDAHEELKAALDMVNVQDLASARQAAARRNEYQRRLAEVNNEIAGLAPGNRSKKLAAGLDALKVYVSEARGRLKSEMERFDLTDLPTEDILAGDIEGNHEEGARLAAEVDNGEATLAGLHDALSRADNNLRVIQDRVATLKGTIETKRADLTASRISFSDEQLERNAEACEGEAIAKDEQVVEKERNQGESLDAIDARISRLEGAAVNHRREVTNLGKEVTRLAALIEVNEGAGVEEFLVAAEAERDRLARSVAEFAQEVDVLELLLDTLETAENEAKTRYLAPVISRVEPYLKMLLPDANMVLDEELRISAIRRADQREDFSVLSGGTREQLAVLTRIAFAELLLGQGRPATLILDDALAFSDDDRIESMFDVLMRAGQNVQIIVLTCRKRLFTRLGATTLEFRQSA